MMPVSRENRPPIVAIGSGAFENILRCDGVLQLGGKHVVQQEESLGGSGLNYTLRLLAAGMEVLPILPVGNDTLGKLIWQNIVAAAEKIPFSSQLEKFLASRQFFVPNVRTPRSTILINQSQTTVFSEKFAEGKDFRRHLEKRFHDIECRLGITPGAVMIGHIYSDKNNGDPHVPGECTRYIIEHWQGKAPIFLNLGHSQIELGIGFWEDAFRQAAVIQMNVWEFKNLMKKEKNSPSLREIIEWFTDRQTTGIITMDRFGALGTYGDGGDGLIYCLPLLPPDRVMDPTGAGDAFAAGLTYQLNGKKAFTFDDFHKAMTEAGIWASFACTTYGGSGSCPDRAALETFLRDLGGNDHTPVRIIDKRSVGPMLDMMDLMYR
jgi:sugar/nucleoside kinase (ribokinase family)